MALIQPSTGRIAASTICAGCRARVWLTGGWCNGASGARIGDDRLRIGERMYYEQPELHASRQLFGESCRGHRVLRPVDAARDACVVAIASLGEVVGVAGTMTTGHDSLVASVLDTLPEDC